MSIDWINFTPWASLGGGALIGLAVSLFVLANGRIAGISGLLGGVMQFRSEGWSEKALFILGLVIAPLVWLAFTALPEIEINTNWLNLVIAGVLVGLGSRYGSGCTSGHGVCGISRLSTRSIVATVCFMTAGFATVYFIRHVLDA
ncbi:YeeE/YedE family protein [Pseudomonas syringae group genomosp. 3]|uniref:Putative trans membrane protein n=1 Tax=Pseudomonas syringae pv. primulae TaxID=251707 RepID=A0A3M3XFC9_9PSED|nr:YeeE/YedE family protein [Pseudomonas syringae group genomosp. 3]RMO68491.1 putative trans membrane protein [Pseudomonas syringae pv. primulae]RMR10205.1 putative trans membrane protein [Pseudomonas syringae pv. primulae]RMU30512.1 putative trans membrane protein [Pseudomonas syringae pv. primulae]